MTNNIFLETIADIVSGDLTVLIPHFVLVVTAIFSLLISAASTKVSYQLSKISTIIGLLTALFVLMGQGNIVGNKYFSGAVTVDEYSTFFLKLGILSTLLISLIVSVKEVEGKISAEFYPLLVFALLGGVFMFSTSNLILMFIALEILSLSVYILVSIYRGGSQCAEAGLKYFILGGAAGAVFLFGAAYLFGFSGVFTLEEIRDTLIAFKGAEVPAYFAFGSLLLIVAFLFKMGAFPFHFWLPDVYHGSLTSVTLFMASFVKMAVFATFIRVVSILFVDSNLVFNELMVLLLGIVAVSTMFFGSISALTQSSLKRLLAYSSISHSGFIILGAVAGIRLGGNFESVIFYVLNYVFLTIGIFTVVMSIERILGKDPELSDLKGFASDHPYLSFAFCIFLFALAGFPPTSGFMAKYYVLSMAVKADLIWLTIFAVLSSVISAYFYLKVVVQMFLKDKDDKSIQPKTILGGSVFGICVSIIIVLFFGLSPQIFFEAVSSLVMAN